VHHQTVKTNDFVVALDHGIAEVAGLIKSPVGLSTNDMRSTPAAPRHSVAVASRPLIVGIRVGMIGNSILSAQQEPVKRTVLFKGDLEGMEGKEGVLFLAELAPSAVGGKHYHPGTEMFYVLQGAFTHEPEGKPPVTLKAGEAGHNPHKHVHTVRNASMTEPAKVLGCLIADKGQPLTVSVK
jgi:quercetin dioxygenase-like cupin family protein